MDFYNQCNYYLDALDSKLFPSPPENIDVCSACHKFPLPGLIYEDKTNSVRNIFCRSCFKFSGLKESDLIISPDHFKQEVEKIKQLVLVCPDCGIEMSVSELHHLALHDDKLPKSKFSRRCSSELKSASLAKNYSSNNYTSNNNNGDLESKLKNLEKRLEDINFQINTTVAHKDDFEEKFNAIERRLQEESTKLRKVQENNADLKQKLTALQNDHSTKLQQVVSTNFELTKRISELENKLQTQLTDLENKLQKQLEDLDTRLQTQPNDLVITLQKQLEDLDTRLQTQPNDLVITLQTQLNDLETRIPQTQPNDIETKIQTQLNDLETRILQTQQNDLETRLQTQLNDLETRLQTQPNELATKLQTQLNDLETRILQKQLNDLNTKLQTQLNDLDINLHKLLNDFSLNTKLNHSEHSVKLSSLEERISHLSSQLKQPHPHQQIISELQHRLDKELLTFRLGTVSKHELQERIESFDRTFQLELNEWKSDLTTFKHIGQQLTNEMRHLKTNYLLKIQQLRILLEKKHGISNDDIGALTLKLNDLGTNTHVPSVDNSGVIYEELRKLRLKNKTTLLNNFKKENLLTITNNIHNLCQIATSSNITSQLTSLKIQLFHDELNPNNNQEELLNLGQTISSFSQIETLHLDLKDGIEVPADTVVSILCIGVVSLVNLKSFYLEFCPDSYSSQAAATFGEALGKLVGLEHLSLILHKYESKDLVSEITISKIENLRSLKSLEIRSRAVSDLIPQTLSNALGKIVSLERLTIDMNNGSITNAGITDLFEGLAKQSHSLKYTKIELKNNAFDKESIQTVERSLSKLGLLDECYINVEGNRLSREELAELGKKFPHYSIQ